MSNQKQKYFKTLEKRSNQTSNSYNFFPKETLESLRTIGTLLVLGFVFGFLVMIVQFM